MKKRFYRQCFMVFLALIFVLCSGVEGLANTNSLGPQVTALTDRSVVSPGESFTVKFAVRNVPDLYGASLDLKFNQELLQVVNLDDVEAGSAFSVQEDVYKATPSLLRDYNDDKETNIDDVNFAGIIQYAVTLLTEVPGISLDNGQWHDFVQVTFKVRDDGNIDFSEKEFIPIDFFFSPNSPDSLEDEKNNGLAVVKLANSNDPDEESEKIEYEPYDATVFVYPSLGEGEYRVSVDWNGFSGENRDLDAHLVIPSQAGPKIDVSSKNEGRLDGYPYAAWTGDIEEYPIEVITLSEVMDGTYQFFIHDYDELKFNGVLPVVTVYDQEGIVDEYDFPQDNFDLGNWWQVFNLIGNEVVSINRISEDSYDGVPAIDAVMPEYLPALAAFNIFMIVKNVDPDDDIEVEIYTDEKTIEFSAFLEVLDVESFEEEIRINAEFNDGVGLYPGKCIVALKVNGQYSIAYPVTITDNPILGDNMLPPVQKAGVSSFEVNIHGFNLEGKGYFAVLKDNNGTIVAESSEIIVEDSVLGFWVPKQLHFYMSALSGDGILSGTYYLEVLEVQEGDDDVPVLDKWGQPYQGEICFTADPEFWNMEPVEFEADSMESATINLYGWNVTGQEWIVKIFNDNSDLIKQYTGITAETIEDLEVLSVTDDLSSLGEGKYYLEVSNNSGLYSKEFAFTVKPVGSSILTIKTESLLDAVKDQGYSASLEASGGTPLYTWTLADGSLPEGFTLNENGEIFGTCSQVGTSEFVVMVTDDSGSSVQKTLSIIVKPIEPLVDSITIDGPVSITIPEEGYKTETYFASVLDQFGGEITGATVTWSLTDSVDGVTIVTNDEDNSVTITVANNALAGVIELKAVSSTNEEVVLIKEISIEADQPIDECFIATAAFGSKFTWPVALLRNFRDQYLLTSTLGRAFVDFYYRNSPPIADFIRGSEGLKLSVKVLLLPMIAVVYMLYHPILAFMSILMIMYLVILRYRRQSEGRVI